MTEHDHGSSGTVFRFPVERVSKARAARPDSASVVTLVTPARAVDFSSWYHQAAIDEEQPAHRPRKI